MVENLYDPDEIVRRSYRYIDERLDVSDFGPVQQRIARRIVHSTGDFALPEKLVFSGSPVQSWFGGFDEELPLVTDVSMVEAGIRNSLLEENNLQTYTYVHREETKHRSNSNELTRSATGLEVALERHDRILLVVGNAPTVLLRLLERESKLQNRIVSVIGAPVGFVSVKESKQQLQESTFDAIVVDGHRGGSPVAASIVNALLEAYNQNENE